MWTIATGTAKANTANSAPLSNPRIMELRWYCIRSRQKQEHLAAAMLRQRMGVEVFCPRLRLRRVTDRGPVWFVEALFPGYIFARLDLNYHLDAVQAMPGVQTLVSFGSQFAIIPDLELEELQQSMAGEEIVERDFTLQVGDQVTIGSGSFRGLSAVVHRLLDSVERVRVLMEFLGQKTELELPVAVLEKAAA